VKDLGGAALGAALFQVRARRRPRREVTP
jgi:hypothetical protein